MGNVNAAHALALLAVYALAACTPAAPDTAAEEVEQAGPGDSRPLAPPSIPTMTSPVGDYGNASEAPPPLVPEVEKGEKGARNLLLSWARAIERDEFDQAWALMGKAGTAEWSRDAFAELFAGLGRIDVAIPVGRMEGAAGSLFYETRVTITADDAGGRPVRIEGPVVLRRANDVPGATPAQLAWHFESIELNATH